MNPEPSITDQLIGYLEGELTTEQARVVALKIREDPAWKAEYEELRRAYLQPNPAEQHPWKQELKVPTTPVFKGLHWVQPVAAALAGILVISLAALYITTPGFHSGPGKAVKTAENLELHAFPPKRINQSLPQETPTVQKAKTGIQLAQLPHSNTPDHSPLPAKIPGKAFRAKLAKAQARRPDQAKMLAASTTDLPAITADQTRWKGLIGRVIGLQVPDKPNVIQTLAKKVLGLQQVESADYDHQYRLVVSEKQPQITATVKIN